MTFFTRLLVAALIVPACLAWGGEDPDVIKSHEEAVSLLKMPDDPTALDKAVILLKKNADLGYAPSESTLAVLYASGKGVPKDSAKTLELLRKASDQGFDKAQHNLALLLLKQNPIPTEEALSWLEKAATQGFLPSQKQLAELYYFGDKGVPMDRSKAKQWAGFGAVQGDPDCENMIGLLIKSENLSEALNWFEKAAKVGNTKAQANLGILLVAAPETRPDGLAWLLIAADKGEPLSTNYLRDYHPANMPELIEEANKRMENIRKTLRNPLDPPNVSH